MFRGLRYITIVVLLTSLCAAEDLNHSVSNREIFFRLCDSVSSDIVQEINHYRSIAVTAGSDSFSSYYLPIFGQGLSSRAIPVYVRPESAETMLTLLVRESSVSFGDVFTESFFGPRLTERRSALKVTGTLVSVTDGKVLWTKDFFRISTDVVAVSGIDQLSNGNPPMTSVVLPELSFLDSVLEPAIVTIASGVVIYLFFTIRS